ncbi:Uncharacterized protein TCM_021218 [Theobroma cacao]|uniref:RING/U-box superfamily protein n=1 Tax=Theobroma cacao TaxID=3641 RepID=A0A061EQA2_THECC|nr:Uncharacterized protein TCM_021218 [Theobroma cacao]
MTAAKGSMVCCSICLEEASDDCDRTVVRLRYCIGSTFNSTGVMRCPNCRQIENGTWRRFDYWNMQDWVVEYWTNDDVEEIVRYNPRFMFHFFGINSLPSLCYFACVQPRTEEATFRSDEWARRLSVAYGYNRGVEHSEVVGSNDIHRHSPLRGAVAEFSANQVTTRFASFGHATQTESVGHLFAHDNQGSSSPAILASVTNGPIHDNFQWSRPFGNSPPPAVHASMASGWGVITGFMGNISNGLRLDHAGSSSSLQIGFPFHASSSEQTTDLFHESNADSAAELSRKYEQWLAEQSRD